MQGSRRWGADGWLRASDRTEWSSGHGSHPRFQALLEEYASESIPVLARELIRPASCLLVADWAGTGSSPFTGPSEMEQEERLRSALADRYLIEREIGSGGMASVYLAQDLKHHRQVAVKVLNPDLAQTLGAKRFLREIETAANLTHPHILPLHDSGEADGFLFYVMPYVKGESLSARLTKEKQLPIEDAVQITREIADALAYAHREGVIHRDVKPANIMLDEGHAVLADFGVAHAVAEAKDERLTRTGTSLGTPAYMSPEQGTGEQDLDGRSDQYALGCVLYEMLTGQPPFTGRRLERILWQHVTVDPPPVTVARPSVPESVAEALHRTLAKRPADRFGTMGEFGAALARPPTPKAAKKPVSARTTLVILASLVIAVFAWFFWPRPAIAFSQGDSILIADFDNLTGDEVFEKSLNTALEISLGQSSYLTVFPRAKIEATLRRMQRTDTESLSGETAREVAEREGIGVVVFPSIATVGGEFALSVRVQDPATGNDLDVTGVSASTKDEVLDAVDQLAEWLRSYLGENLTTLSVQRRPLARVTTPSLEALRHFSLGLRHRLRGELEDAKLGYQNAVRIDSTFTSALATLGILEFEHFSRDEGIDLLKRAITNLDRVTEKERLGILGFYSQAIEGDLEKAAGYYRAGINLYPNDLAFQNNLGWAYFQQGSFAEALKNYKEALRIDPDAGVTYDGLVRIYLYNLPNLDSARVWVHRQHSRDLGGKWAFDNLGWMHLGQDSLDAAVLAFEEALRFDPAMRNSRFRVAHTQRLKGEYQEALVPLRQILARDSTYFPVFYEMGVIYHLMEDTAQARKQFERFLESLQDNLEANSDDFFNKISTAMAFARLGEERRGREFGRNAMDIDSTSSDAHFDLARLSAVLGQTDSAVNHLNQAVQRGFRNFIWMKIHPDLISLYDDPRFKAIVQKGLHPES